MAFWKNMSQVYTVRNRTCIVIFVWPDELSLFVVSAVNTVMYYVSGA